RRLAHVDVNELPHVEVRRELLLQCRLPRFHFIEIARQLPSATIAVAQDSSRHQRVTLRFLDTKPVDDAHRIGTQLSHWNAVTRTHANGRRQRERSRRSSTTGFLPRPPIR